METYIYKRLDAEDVALVQQLRQVFAEAFEEDSVWNTKEPTEQYLAQVLADEHYIALVAIAEKGEVVGGLVAYVLPKIDQERSEIYLYDLAVTTAHRRRGIATELISQLKVVAQNYGANVIFVQADNDDAPAVALYTKLAEQIESDVTHFDIKVE